VPNEGDAWQFTMDELGRYVKRVTMEIGEHEANGQLVVPDSLLDLAGQSPPRLASEMIGLYLQSADLLGRRTAEMHVALSKGGDDSSFAPEPFTAFYQRGLFQSMRTEAKKAFHLLRRQLKHLPESEQAIAARALEREPDVLERFKAISDRKIAALRLRTHGDYHLGQVLFTGKDFLIIDFEGEPDRPMSERRIKRSPLRDVAGMVRSFHYASAAALMGQVPGALIPPESRASAGRWLRFWYAWVSATYLRSYLAVARSANFLPQTDDELRTMLNAYILEKAMYELGYELNNRPDWVGIPLQGILQISESDA
jgi:maltose alpha-D-glucosyltransferase / alpha-amylase